MKDMRPAANPGHTNVDTEISPVLYIANRGTGDENNEGHLVEDMVRALFP